MDFWSGDFDKQDPDRFWRDYSSVSLYLAAFRSIMTNRSELEKFLDISLSPISPQSTPSKRRSEGRSSSSSKRQAGFYATPSMFSAEIYRPTTSNFPTEMEEDTDTLKKTRQMLRFYKRFMSSNKHEQFVFTSSTIYLYIKNESKLPYRSFGWDATSIRVL